MTAVEFQDVVKIYGKGEGQQCLPGSVCEIQQAGRIPGAFSLLPGAGAVMGVQKKDMRLVIHSVCAERALRVCGEFRDIIDAAAVLCGLNAPGAQKGEGLLPAGAP